MSTATLILGAVAILVLLGVAAIFMSSRRRGNTKQRSGQLREQFGTEYDRTLAATGDARKTERELTSRQKRVSSFHIKTLEADEGKHFSDEWLAIKAGFVDDPSAAVREAEALLGRVLDARGYPTGDFDQRAADLSVDHSAALERHRAAHELALTDGRGEAHTEDLRQALVDDHYLFAEMIGEPPTAAEPAEVVPADPAAAELDPALDPAADPADPARLGDPVAAK